MDVPWEVVYVVIFAPAVMLGANFMFGSCAVADALELRTDNMEKRPSWRHRTIGRCSLTGVVVCTAWQYWECLFALRWFEHENSASCNPVYAVYFAVDSMSAWAAGFNTRDELRDERRCTNWEISYLSSVSTMVLLLWYCVTSSPHAQVAGPHTSYCRKCMSHVRHMDHHCYFLHNCVGESNRNAFVMLVAAVGIVAVHVLVRCPLSFVVDTWHSSLGYLVTLIVLIGSTCLGVFQLLLLWKGLTTVQFLKRVKGKAWLWALRDLCC